MTDKSIMPFGKYKGYLMENVPASYLIWLYENSKCTKEVAEYILDNMEILKLELKN